MTIYVEVFVDGVARDTEIDDNGTQRFVEHPSTTYNGVSVCAKPGDGPDEMSWNQLAIDHAHGLVTDEEYKRYHMDSGYSVSGFLECVPKVRIDNPLWDEPYNGFETEDLIAELGKWREDLTDVPLLDRAIAKLEEQRALLED